MLHTCYLSESRYLVLYGMVWLDMDRAVLGWCKSIVHVPLSLPCVICVLRLFEQTIGNVYDVTLIFPVTVCQTTAVQGSSGVLVGCL